MTDHMNPFGQRVWKVSELDREQLLVALKITDSHVIVEGLADASPIVLNVDALDQLVADSAARAGEAAIRRMVANSDRTP